MDQQSKPISGFAPAEQDATESTEAGYESTLRKRYEELGATLGALEVAGSSGPRLSTPLCFDSLQDTVSTYVAALNRVRNRFWTTSRLSSGFWIGRRADIIEANDRMMKRLRQSGGDVRRLFLLDQTPEKVVHSYREQRIMLHRLGDSESVSRLDEAFENMTRNVQLLREGGCDLRITFDADHRGTRLPNSMQWRPLDSELAIYDEFRVDVFAGGRGGTIGGLISFSRAIEGFDDAEQAAGAFFLSLWSQAMPMEAYLERLQAAVEAARSRIRYWPHRLAQYEFGCDDTDADIKSSEAALTEKILREQDCWGSIERYLDIGTCTGRYLLHLRDAVTPEGTVIGLDDNLDSILFTRGNIAQHCPEDKRISILQRDFESDASLPPSSFDLVTCMMSTVSHFGRDRNDRYDDTLQRVLARMIELLRPSGRLLFSTWSPAACDDQSMLSIYEADEIASLSEWTPSIDEFKDRLRIVGFETIECHRPDRRLCLWHCVRPRA